MQRAEIEVRIRTRGNGKNKIVPTDDTVRKQGMNFKREFVCALVATRICRDRPAAGYALISVQRILVFDIEPECQRAVFGELGGVVRLCKGHLLLRESAPLFTDDGIRRNVFLGTDERHFVEFFNGTHAEGDSRVVLDGTHRLVGGDEFELRKRHFAFALFERLIPTDLQELHARPIDRALVVGSTDGKIYGVPTHRAVRKQSRNIELIAVFRIEAATGAKGHIIPACDRAVRFERRLVCKIDSERKHALAVSVVCRKIVRFVKGNELRLCAPVLADRAVSGRAVKKRRIRSQIGGIAHAERDVLWLCHLRLLVDNAGFGFIRKEESEVCKRDVRFSAHFSVEHDETEIFDRVGSFGTAAVFCHHRRRERNDDLVPTDHAVVCKRRNIAFPFTTLVDRFAA